MKPAERQHRDDLRALVVDIAEADALTDPWGDVALALDKDEPLDDLRELVRVANFDRSPGDRAIERLDELLLAIEEATGSRSRSSSSCARGPPRYPSDCMRRAPARPCLGWVRRPDTPTSSSNGWDSCPVRAPTLNKLERQLLKELLKT